jgi:hypothetical protein
MIAPVFSPGEVVYWPHRTGIVCTTIKWVECEAAQPTHPLSVPHTIYRLSNGNSAREHHLARSWAEACEMFSLQQQGG